MRDSLTTVIVNWNKVLCGGLNVSVLWGPIMIRPSVLEKGLRVD